MAQGDLPPQLRDQLTQFQNLQGQLQTLAAQRAQLDARAKEYERAQEALAEVDAETTIYRSVGSLLVKTKGKEAVLSQISDEAETVGVRLKNFEKQEARLKESLNELQSKIEAGLKRLQPAGE